MGLILLVAFHPDWWQHVGMNKGLLVVLGGAALGYLAVEARNHNTGSVAGGPGTPLVLVGRALAVAATGFVHSFFVAVMGMVTITTVFGRKGPSCVRSGREVRIWATQSDLVGGHLLVSGSRVFSQILWDDQPITAPLSHRRWRER